MWPFKGEQNSDVALSEDELDTLLHINALGKKKHL